MSKINEKTKEAFVTAVTEGTNSRTTMGAKYEHAYALYNEENNKRSEDDRIDLKSWAMEAFGLPALMTFSQLEEKVYGKRNKKYIPLYDDKGAAIKKNGVVQYKQVVERGEPDATLSSEHKESFLKINSFASWVSGTVLKRAKEDKDREQLQEANNKGGALIIPDKKPGKDATKQELEAYESAQKVKKALADSRVRDVLDKAPAELLTSALAAKGVNVPTGPVKGITEIAGEVNTIIEILTIASAKLPQNFKESAAVKHILEDAVATLKRATPLNVQSIQESKEPEVPATPPEPTKEELLAEIARLKGEKAA